MKKRVYKNKQVWWPVTIANKSWHKVAIAFTSTSRKSTLLPRNWRWFLNACDISVWRDDEIPPILITKIWNFILHAKKPGLLLNAVGIRRIPQLVSKLLDVAEINFNFWFEDDITLSSQLEKRSFTRYKKNLSHLKAEPTPADYQMFLIFEVRKLFAKKQYSYHVKIN